MIKRSALTVSQRIKLYEWLRINATQEKVNAAKHTYTSLAEAAASTLKFEVSRASIEPLLSELGVKTSFGNGSNGHAPGSVKARLDTLETQLKALYADLGKPLPA